MSWLSSSSVAFLAVRGLGVAIAVLGAIITTLSRLSRVCNFAGKAAQNDDAVMYYSEGLYMAQRRFASFSRSNAPDPDKVMQVCVDASNFWIQIAQQGTSMRLKDMLAGLTSPYVVVQSVYKEIRTCEPFCSGVMTTWYHVA